MFRLAGLFGLTSHCMKRSVLGQTSAAWLIAFLTVPFGVWIAVAGLGLDDQFIPANWLKIEIDTPCSTAPRMIVTTGRQGPVLGEVIWQPYAQTLVGVRKRDGAGPLQILAIETDGEIVPLETVSILGQMPNSRSAGAILPWR